MKNYKKFLYVLSGLALSFVLLLTAVEMVTFDMNHYAREYEKHDIMVVTGMDKENLQHVTKELLSYLRDDREDLNIRAVVKGEEREVFGEREKLHMIDVKELFVGGRWIRNISLFLLGGLLIFFVAQDKLWRRGISKTLMYTAMANIDLIIILFLLMYFNFTKYFDYFHYIFFDNDLWVLDPNADIMIQMLPEAFFYNTAVKIAVIYIGFIMILGVTGFWRYRKNKNYNE
ncbi:integral membrane protein TIGR01906 [Anaerovirgula multivorans]|uniref:Integral membrane protein TIGR01906 n=1 Tax=Anaerovirgula multivorans TaxID=312168 RepID=A0A239GS34_9FIRM|nr:TIGR01906 family membrane protein [Anaerovirgula multivorans]SNS71652.1 integral membrane protein TIGR01906 [Anaerovirgula multivorans]